MVSEEFEKRFYEAIDDLRRRKFVDATELSLNEWIALLKPDHREELVFVDWQFPTKKMREGYLDTIHARTDREVINLLRNFLIPSGNLGADDLARDNLLRQDKKRLEELLDIEHVRRLLTEETPWEGNMWIIDLLPDNPKLALEALRAYLVSHFPFLPDGRIEGLLDAMATIRAKFIEAPRRYLLLSLDPYQFESLIAALYSRMGYKTTLTQRTYDKGIDVIAEKRIAGEREKVLIQCRRTEKNMGVEDIRALLGVVSNEKATKGVFVCTSEFTPEARKLEAQNHRLELIGNKNLQTLLNEYLGSRWSVYVDSIISERLSKEKDRSRTTSHY